MRELHDLMDDVRSDLTVVRWPDSHELRRRVRRRRQRTIVAAVALVTAVTASAASLARPPHRASPPPPAATSTVDASPVQIPQSALLRPEDVGAGPDTQNDGEGASKPIDFTFPLYFCFEKRAPELLAVRPRYSHGQTLLLGTESDRPDRPYVLGQATYRLTASQATTFLPDLRAALKSCQDFTQTGEYERPEGTVEARGHHNWSIVASGFAGDDSILVRHDAVARNAKTNQVIGESNALLVYLRVGELITVLDPRAGTSADDLLRIATTAAQRLCTIADPPCR
jgi:hypothetical protein